MERQQRVQYVFQGLVQQVKASQKSLQAYLLQKKKMFRSFNIENAILVNNADQETIQEISQWKGVRDVGLNTMIRMKEIPTSEAAPGPKKLAGHLPLIQVDKAWNQLNAKAQGL